MLVKSILYPLSLFHTPFWLCGAAFIFDTLAPTLHNLLLSLLASYVLNVGVVYSSMTYMKR